MLKGNRGGWVAHGRARAAYVEPNAALAAIVEPLTSAMSKREGHWQPCFEIIKERYFESYGHLGDSLFPLDQAGAKS